MLTGRVAVTQARRLLTIGYAGHTPSSFLAALRQHDVCVVIDVRQNPVSRKKGFSRAALAAFLAANNIEYIHQAAFGVPIELRKQLKSGQCDLAAYFDVFRAHLSKRGEALNQLYELATRAQCCLMCAERLPEECHRSLVANAVENRNGHHLKVVHL
jgi:uncharacterized protein (DUF488 family)